jgi:hypothetical protein
MKTKLYVYHTTQANSLYKEENYQVANKLREGKINSYEEYLKACRMAGCTYYNEAVYNDHIKGIERTGYISE